MRKLMGLVLLGVLLSIPAAARAERQALSDAELDAVTAGEDVCSLAGVSSPCVISFFEVFEGPQPTPTSTPTASSIQADPLPPNSSVTQTQSFTSSKTSISQRNSASRGNSSWQNSGYSTKGLGKKSGSGKRR